jgi:hypothetical protein
MTDTRTIARDEPRPSDWSDEFGDPVKVVLTLRNGLVLTEWLPDYIAELRVAQIPICEPDVARARIER